MNADIFNLLRRSYKFIPTPSGCCHWKILQDLQDFLRKYKWHHVMSGRPRRLGGPANRSSLKSTKEPPAVLVPHHVLERCARISHIVSANLKSCELCFSRENLSFSERKALRTLTNTKDYRQLCDDKFYVPCEESLCRYTAVRLTQLLDSEEPFY